MRRAQTPLPGDKMRDMTLQRVVPAFLAALFLACSFASSAAAPQLNLRFENLEEALKLTPVQKAQYDAAVGATKRMMMQLALAAMQVKQRLLEELAKPRPDFGVIEEARQALLEDGKTLRREARQEWLRLYAMLDDDQVATLKRFVQDQVENVGILHDFLLQLILGAQAER
jgi:hypothetical protein